MLPSPEPLTVEDLPAIGTFLRTVFSPDLPRIFDDETLRWKAFSPHPWQPGPRSYGIKVGGQLQAHGIVVPLRFRNARDEFKGQCVIDWASGPAMRGGGVLIYRGVANQADFQIGIAGSDSARSVLPRMGFKPKWQMTACVRVQNPISYYMAGDRNWKTPARIIREHVQNVRRRPSAQGGLTARAVDRFSESVPMPYPVPQGGATVSVRSAELLNYLLTFPATRMEGYEIEHAGKLLGYCLLSRIGYECRVADLWIASADSQDWREAIGLATQLAGPASRAVVSAASTPLERSAWIDSGYAPVSESPVYILDRRGLISDGVLRVGLIDNDGFYL